MSVLRQRPHLTNAYSVNTLESHNHNEIIWLAMERPGRKALHHAVHSEILIRLPESLF